MLAALLIACAVCQNPAIAPANEEATDSVAMSAALDVRAGSFAIGEGGARQAVTERRIESRLGIRPIAELTIAIGVPVLIRSLATELGEALRVVPGDVELFALAQLFEARDAVWQRVHLTGVVKFPSAPVQADAAGEPLASNLQPGCSSVVAGISAMYEFGQSLWAVQLSAGTNLPFVVREAPHRGSVTRAGGTLELRPMPALTLSAGLSWMFEVTGEDAAGEAEANSGGATGWASAGIDTNWGERLRAGVGIDIPAVRALRGEQAPSPIAMVRVSGQWDLF